MPPLISSSNTIFKSLTTANPPAKKPNIPAIDLPLTGKYLIEASAGTGKTWTLTGIVLRLLIEGGYPCEKIIATTFTRSAAADIQARIRERLTDFREVLQLAETVLKKLAETAVEPAMLPEKFLTSLEASAPDLGELLINEKGEKEAVYWYLMDWLANQQFKERHEQSVNFAIMEYRYRTALNQLDKLYVGTLDSLCQKWLREFSAETGYQPDIQITTHEEPLIKSMLHDQLRAFQEAIHVNDPVLYQRLQAMGQLPKVNDYYHAVVKALTFFTVPIDNVPLVNYDLAKIGELVEQIIQADTADFEPYTDESYRLEQGFGSASILHKRFNDWQNIRWLLKTYGLQGVWLITKSQLEWLQNVSLCVETGKSISTKNPETLVHFKKINLVNLLVELYQAIQQAEKKSANIRHYFTQFISNYVRQQLPLVLESRQQTTFSLQLARLNHALASKQGEALARYIRHQYPIALIDESQDINTEQALLLQKIYLPNNSPAPSNTEKEVKATKQFLLLVGDPKQAIYGFRGGDVVNYTQIKRQFPPKNIHELTQNHRSSAMLVTGLNHFFGCPDTQLDTSLQENSLADLSSKPFFLGEDIFYRHITAHREVSALQPHSKSMQSPQSPQGEFFTTNESPSDEISHNDPAIVVLNSDDMLIQSQSQDLEIVVTMESVISAQILALFDPETGYSYKAQPLKFEDIGILATSHQLLTSIEQHLHGKNIPTMRGGNKSLFSGEMAHILLVLMNTLIYPYHIARLKRLLMTPLFGLNLVQVEQLLQQEISTNQLSAVTLSTTDFTQFTDIQNSLTDAHKIWQKQGFLTAVQSWLDLPMQMAGETQPINFWQRLAIDPTGERLLIDLRHLMDVISQFGKGMGEHQLVDWVALMVSEQPREDWSLQQRLASEDGVQLMTMHSSKGLEFPIVFAVGLEKPLTVKKSSQNSPALYLYNGNAVTAMALQNANKPLDKKGKKTATATTQTAETNAPSALPISTSISTPSTISNSAMRRLSPLSYQPNNQGEIYKEIEQQADYEDRLRLAYVALTRAKDRLYITAQATKSPLITPLSRWLEPKRLQVPEKLQPFIIQADINSLSKYFNSSYNVTAKENPTLAEQIPYHQWVAQIHRTKFIGWSNTSFTALTHHLNQDKIAVAINEPDYISVEESEIPELGDIIFESTEETLADISDLPIRFAFEKGVRAGTFLHQVLENLMESMSAITTDNDGQNQHWRPNTTWSTIIDKAVKEAQLPQNLLSVLPNTDQAESGEGQSTAPDLSLLTSNPSHLALANWLYEVMQTPLQASGISLQQIPQGQRLAELGFNMSLNNEFNLNALQTLFKDHAIALNFELNQPTSQYWRYLRGEIDLVYQHNGRFYVVDYKSNWLGTNFDNYHETALKQTMTEHGYWLQASIYQVALHRYLSLRLPNYDIDTHLGAVEYAFIRGMSPDLPEYGKLVWQPTTEFILALDNLFGKAH